MWPNVPVLRTFPEQLRTLEELVQLEELAVRALKILAVRGKTPVPMTSIHPEASGNLLGALRSASIDEEHHTIMSVVIQKVQSAKSGLTEAHASLLTGFEVCI